MQAVFSGSERYGKSEKRQRTQGVYSTASHPGKAYVRLSKYICARSL